MNDTVSEAELAAGRGYERLFVPALFGPWTKHVIAAADIQKGSRVLDIACGTGILARDARSAIGETGRVTGLDPAPGMIATAQEIAPDMEWVRGSAEDLEFEDATFDRVLCQFGMMFFQHPQKAVKEMYRVMAPGGRLAVAVWNSIVNNPAYEDIIDVLDEQVGIAAGDALRLPFSMGDASEVTKLLDNSGFSDIAADTRTEQANFPSARAMVEAELRGWLPLFDINLDEEEIAEVLTRSDILLAKYATPSGEAVFPTSAHVVTASKR
ncbi:methyltransferase domain-containing protein [Defluviimonas sp. WL0002]|uniref:Methyltransferase domain-containing protein n=1 Tax=Albidovulum marisflavi TaxID=2984159 RepID=A0ABT2ZA12_9RHOB|nr:methyltransferase domain-containing protein [Defluviimonas sp. WL0002]MCV2867616.1 methyltransferase domain-containing protein [Defluviimonas sp. WL0002]